MTTRSCKQMSRPFQALMVMMQFTLSKDGYYFARILHVHHQSIDQLNMSIRLNQRSMQYGPLITEPSPSSVVPNSAPDLVETALSAFQHSADQDLIEHR